MDKSDGVGHVKGQWPAVDFVDNRLREHDPAILNVPSRFDEVSGKYIPLIRTHSDRSSAGPFAGTSEASRPQTPLGVIMPGQVSQHVESQSMRFWNDIFSETMQVLLTDSSEPTPLAKSGGGIRNANSWEEVYARLDEAQITYTDGEGTSGKLKRVRRKVADNLSQPAAHIARIVPDVEPRTTPVAGTVGLLLQAMSTAARTREEVLTSLSDLDKTFSNIDSFAATFPTDQNVRQASVSLVMAIFQAVEHAIVFFTESAGKNVAALVFKASDYQEELLNSFNEIQKRSDYLIQEAQKSHYESTRASIQDVLSRQDRLLAGQVQAAQLSADMKNTVRSMMEMYTRQKELYRKQHQEELRRIEDIQKQRSAMHRRDREELLALVHQLQVTPRPVSPLPLQYTHPAAVRNFPIWTAQTLLQVLGVPDISVSDLHRVKELESTLSQSNKRKAGQVLQENAFRHWMWSPKPAKLLIHGCFRGSKTVSPLSLVTATLTEMARADQHHFVSQVFFCGCHIDPEEDAFSGAKALMRVLISQLLQQRPDMNISPSPWELDIDGIRDGDLQQFCQLFNLLVHRLPGDVTLYCLIDGMVYYERDDFVADMQYVLTETTRLVGDPTVQASVKLLITAPWRTEMAHQFFQEDQEILHMEGMPSVPHTSGASRVIHRHISHTESDPSSRDSSPEPWE